MPAICGRHETKGEEFYMNIGRGMKRKRVALIEIS